MHGANCSTGARGDTRFIGKAIFLSVDKLIKWPKKHGFNKILICSKCHGKTIKRIKDDHILKLIDFGYEVYKRHNNENELITKRKKWWRNSMG